MQQEYSSSDSEQRRRERDFTMRCLSVTIPLKAEVTQGRVVYLKDVSYRCSVKGLRLSVFYPSYLALAMHLILRRRLAAILAGCMGVGAVPRPLGTALVFEQRSILALAAGLIPF